MLVIMKLMSNSQWYFLLPVLDLADDFKNESMKNDKVTFINNILQITIFRPLYINFQLRESIIVIQTLFYKVRMHLFLLKIGNY